MSDKPISQVPPPSPESRRIAAERFDRANQVINSGDFDYGIQLLLTCCKLDPANMLFRQTLRRTQKGKYKNNLRGSRLAIITTIRTRAKLKSARRAGDHLKALEYGEEILSRNPWDTGAQMDMAESCENLGLLDMAIFILDQARQKNPKDPTVNRVLARFFEKRGNFSHAIALWQLVKEVVPDDLEAAHKAKDLAASETIQRGNYEESASGERSALQTKLLQNKPEEPQDRVTRDAAPILARIEANPTDPHLYSQLAAVYRKGNQPERARAAIEQGLGPTGNHYVLTIEIMELDLEPFRENLRITEEKLRHARNGDESEDGPSPEELQRIRMRLMREINSREIELFRLKADRFPQELINRLELGIRLYRIEQIEEAIVELQQARKEPKVVARALTYLGFCFKKRNNWRLAQRNFEEALALTPESDESARKELLYQLAQGHADAGDLAKALDLGHELANLDFGFRDIGRLLDEWQERFQQA